MNIRPLPSVPPQKVSGDELSRERDGEQDIDQELEDIAHADLPLLRRIAFRRPDLLALRDLRLALLLTLYPRVVQLSLLFPIVLVSSRPDGDRTVPKMGHTGIGDGDGPQQTHSHPRSHEINIRSRSQEHEENTQIRNLPPATQVGESETGRKGGVGEGRREEKRTTRTVCSRSSWTPYDSGSRGPRLWASRP